MEWIDKLKEELEQDELNNHKSINKKEVINKFAEQKIEKVFSVIENTYSKLESALGDVVTLELTPNDRTIRFKDRSFSATSECNGEDCYIVFRQKRPTTGLSITSKINLELDDHLVPYWEIIDRTSSEYKITFGDYYIESLIEQALNK